MKERVELKKDSTVSWEQIIIKKNNSTIPQFPWVTSWREKKFQHNIFFLVLGLLKSRISKICIKGFLKIAQSRFQGFDL